MKNFDIHNWQKRYLYNEEVKKNLNEAYFDDLDKAKEYAKRESEGGFVQHVNKHPKGGFRVEDWMDGSLTVASYEGGEPV